MTDAPTPTPETVLVVDDDVAIARFLEVHLHLHGFTVQVAHDSDQAWELVARKRPDLAVVDICMSSRDGLELTRRLRGDPMTAAMPIILLTAKSHNADKVLGLTAGADDYMTKPFDAAELVARVRSTLRRIREFREISPLTGLPGNTRILREISERVRCDGDYAVCVFDIDRFKSVNDAYGFSRGDEFITMLASCLHRSVTAAGLPAAFLGHIGGDDFVVVCAPDQVHAITKQAVDQFEAAADELYDPVDVERGYLELVDRRGNVQRPNLVTISIGVALSTARHFSDPREVITVANEMKQVAKNQPGSFVAYDRRRG